MLLLSAEADVPSQKTEVKIPEPVTKKEPAAQKDQKPVPKASNQGKGAPGKKTAGGGNAKSGAAQKNIMSFFGKK